MLEFILGVGAGVLLATLGIPLLKKNGTESKENGGNMSISRLTDELSDENEKLKRRTKEMQQEIDELTNKNLKLSRQLKEKTDAQDDANDDIDSYKKKVLRLESRISQLEVECKEWETVCNELKSQLNK